MNPELHFPDTPGPAPLPFPSAHIGAAAQAPPAPAPAATASPPMDDWILVLNPTVDPEAFAAELCAADSPLRKAHAFACTGTLTTLLRAVTGCFTRAAIRELSQRYKGSLDHVTRDRGLPRASTCTSSTRAIRATHDPVPDHCRASSPSSSIPSLLPVSPPTPSPPDPSDRLRPPPAPGASGASRVAAGWSVLDGSGAPEATDDCYGHGTHVAALVAGLSSGVAKNATLHPVKVLDCYGNANESTLLQGLDWVARNLQRPAVVHMSIEGYYSTAINAAVDELVNRGSCLDLFAPGVSILSAVPWSDSALATKTGTSMAAPFASGVAAAYLQTNPGASSADVLQRLLRSARPGGVSDDRYGLATFTPAGGSTSASTSTSPSSSFSPSSGAASTAAAASPSLAATLSAAAWGPLDISSTPNRLLQSVLEVPDTAPDVVYSFTPSRDLSVTASTCGSSFDTVLLLGLGGLAPEQVLANDDDPGCGTASRLDAALPAGVTAYWVVSGFNGAAGTFRFSLTCGSCVAAGGAAEAAAASAASM
ncbi:hypothetical protein GPECTOR_59g626 [Gonium pectorale]|uniref:Peptidase S8/S53 domain-containing protein n=1 Tax=Gonium pectorale TaxID=33097 RepID=A0A150G564_GONPE|nr:hypothetical protein GPECTOR_59g626 [Gonium pectorale]|eukprot:KXZ45019.1 hypothetical protein GPECTOR_59g626 [Gonium pectorale]